MAEIQSRLKSAADRERWVARGATFVAKAKATKVVWFPPKPVDTGREAASTATRATRRATKKTTGVAKKSTGAAAKKSTGAAEEVSRRGQKGDQQHHEGDEPGSPEEDLKRGHSWPPCRPEHPAGTFRTEGRMNLCGGRTGFLPQD